MANVDKVDAYVAGLKLDAKGETLAEVARLLAHRLDGEHLCRGCAGPFFHAPSGRDAANLAKELRAVLADLDPKVSDEPDDDWTAPPAPKVRAPKERKARDVGSAGRRGGAKAGAAAAPVAAARPRRGARGAA